MQASLQCSCLCWTMLVNVCVTGSVWQCDWSWLHIVCSEVPFYLFVRICLIGSHSGLLPGKHNVVCIQEVNRVGGTLKQEVHPARVKLIFACIYTQINLQRQDSYIVFFWHLQWSILRFSGRPQVTTCS